jgi:hypothetical protein
MATPLKYYVGINIKSDRRQVFGVHGKPTAASHGKHFSAVIGPFANLRAALYVRDHGFNNPAIRCPGDAEKLCKTRSAPTFQRTAAKLKRRAKKAKGKARRAKRKGRARHSVRAVRPKSGARRNPAGDKRKLTPAQLRAGFGGKARQRRRNPVGNVWDKVRKMKVGSNSIIVNSKYVVVRPRRNTWRLGETLNEVIERSKR